MRVAMANLISSSIFLLFVCLAVADTNFMRTHLGIRRSFQERSNILERILDSEQHTFPERRGHADFGLMSRHFAGSDYARALEANKIAADPFGPGRKKRFV
ncbi:uncharacterized protein LOC121382275 isoform X3 [Gigantopelta aegis]|uniref:uncharacterized protein LOC121382275 isoform X3 n=1 Tax=Gigantopelta aegis TaxID=1735272 RepID=UPI001B8882A9|nr:uncharacterized protein LOC121382275 isoform X3 [Gigantopelta aegis]